MRYRQIKLLEVPEPNKEQNPELNAAFVSLGKANSALLHGNWRESVGLCRDVLDALSEAAGDEGTMDPAFDALFEKSKSKDKRERVQALRRGLKLIASAARHNDKVTAKIDWSRSDAVAMTTMMTILLQWHSDP